MKKIISYSLFHSVKHDWDRWWDRHIKESDRYWVNIPVIIIANSICFPEFITRFYIGEAMTKHRLFKFFDLLKDLEYVEIVKMPNSINKQGMLWRLQPLFEKNVGFLCSRDIDSVITPSEIQATYSFMKSGFLLQGIRSHKYHGGEDHSLLGGLSNYNVELIHKTDYLKGITYEILMDTAWKISLGEFNWHFDLDTLNFLFAKDKQKAEQICETIIDNAIETVYKRKRIIGADKYNINFIPIRIRNVLSIISEWAGEPVDAREYLTDFLDFNTHNAKMIKAFLEANKDLEDFFMRRELYEL